VHDQAAECMPLGMYQPISVGNAVQPQPLPAQGNGTSQAAREEGLVDRLAGIGGQDPQGDTGMAGVEAAPGSLTLTVDNIHVTAARDPLGRLFHHLLKNPWMGRTPRNLEPHLTLIRRRGMVA